MVEITYQMVLSTLQTAGLLVGIIYYITTLRNQQKTQQVIFETRQLQYLLDYNAEIVEKTLTNLKQYQEVMNADWTDFEDFLEKHGPNNSPENHNLRMHIWRRYHVTGLMLRDGLIDVETYVEYMGDSPIMMWRKYKDIVEEYRRRFHLPTMYLGWEILAEEIEKYRIKQGWGSKTPNDI